jgi:integrase
LASSTIGVVYSFLAGIFRAAVRDRLIGASPCVSIRLPKPEPKRVEPLATEKVEALIEAMPSRYRALVVLAAGTGLHQGEAFAVEVEAVDWLRRTLRVDRQLVLLPGGEPYITPPKTPASYRTMPLPQIVDALAAHLATFPATRVEILDATHKPDPKRRRATLVFTGATGRPLRRTRFSDIWRPAAWCRSASATRARSRPSTPTPTSGPTPRTAPARRSTRSWAGRPSRPARRRRRERMCTDCARPGQGRQPCAGQLGCAGGVGL